MTDGFSGTANRHSRVDPEVDFFSGTASWNFRTVLWDSYIYSRIEPFCATANRNLRVDGFSGNVIPEVEPSIETFPGVYICLYRSIMYTV